MKSKRILRWVISWGFNFNSNELIAIPGISFIPAKKQQLQQGT